MFEILELKFSKLLAFLFFISGTLLPGNLLIYVYNRQIYTEIDVIKLIIISFAISIPTFIGYFFIANYTKLHPKSAKSREEEFQYQILAAGLINSVHLYIVLIGHYLRKYDLKGYMVALGLLELLTLFILGIRAPDNKRKSKAKKENASKVKNIPLEPPITSSVQENEKMSLEDILKKARTDYSDIYIEYFINYKGVDSITKEDLDKMINHFGAKIIDYGTFPLLYKIVLEAESDERDNRTNIIMVWFTVAVAFMTLIMMIFTIF